MWRGMSAVRDVRYEQCEQNNFPSRRTGSLSSWMGTCLFRGAVLRTRPQEKDGLVGRDALERTRPARGAAFFPHRFLESCDVATTVAGSEEERTGEGVADAISTDDSDAAGEKMLAQSEVDVEELEELLQLEDAPCVLYCSSAEDAAYIWS